MARYLIVQEQVIVDDVEATSIRAAVEGLNAEGNGAFDVYTVQGARTVQFHTVTETRLVFPGESSGNTDEAVEEE